MKLRKFHRARVIVLSALFACLAAAVGARLYSLQVAQHGHFQERAERQHLKKVVLQPERGDILDRAGRPLAQSTGRMTLYAIPTYFRTPEIEPTLNMILASLSVLTGERIEDLDKRLKGTRPTAILKRMRPELASQVLRALDDAGVDGRGFWLHREAVRLYPRHLAAPVIGYTAADGDGDTDGAAGLEKFYNDHLRGKKIVSESPRSAISETLRPADPDDLLKARGNSLILTLDANIQEATEEIIARHAEKAQAKAAGAIVMDPNSGGVLAMASWPTFDNNEFSKAVPDHMRNRIITDPFETGSVVKLFTAAMLIDEGLITPETLVDCEGGYAVVDGRRLKDSPGHAPLHVVPFRTALRYSSNVGIVKLALGMENKRWHERLRNFGFGQQTGIDLPGEGRGILYPVEKWTRLSRTSLPMGYETSLTSIEIAAGISAVVNGGKYFRPHLVQEIRDPRGNTVYQHDAKPDRQVIRPTTSAIMRDLMEEVVDLGTGKRARVAGYRIGGKTGTTRKSNVFDRREYIASFVGVLPIDDPKLTIYLYIDAPQGAYYAGEVAAPAFQEIARAATIHLGIAPGAKIDTEAAEAAEEGEMAFADEPQPPPGTMPNFRGLAMADAAREVPQGIAKVKFLGTGFVADQFPPPGDPIDARTELVLQFAPDPAPSRPEGDRK